MTFETAFKRLKDKFANVDATVLEDMAIQITLSDEDCGGTFYAAVRNHVLAVEPYDYKDNDAVIDVTRAALASLLDGKTTIDKAIEKGDMSVMGDLQKVAAIRNALKIPEKKPTPRKKAAAKAPAEKAPEKKTRGRKPKAKEAPVTPVAPVAPVVAAAPVEKSAPVTAEKKTTAPAKKPAAVKKTTAKKTTK